MLFVKDDLMRVQHWITAILSAVLLLPSSKAVFAQGGPGYSQQPGGWSTMPGPFPQSVSYGPAYETWPTSHEPGLLPHHQSSFVPSFSPLNMNPQGQAGYRPEMLPWPNVSQFHGPSYSEMHHTNGLWHFDSSSGGKRYFGSVEYLRGRFKKADGVVGQPGAARYKDYALPIIHETPIGLDELADAFQGDAPNSDFLLDGLADQVGFFPQVGEPGYNYYDRAFARETGHPKSNGIRVRWGFLEADDRGVIIDGWWTGKGVSEMIGENGATRHLTQPGLLFRFIDSPNGFLESISPFTQESVLRSNILNLRGLPVNDGTLEQLPDGRYIGGTTIPYDLEFNLKFKSQAAGTSVNFLMMPIVKKKNIKVRPILGARYLYVKEEFNFFGHDSGLSYDNQDLGDIIFPRLKIHSLPDGIDGDGNGNIDDPGGPEDPDPTAGQQQAIDQGRFIRLDLVADLVGVEHPGRYQAFIDNVAVSHLIGPEIGLQYDIGGDRLKLRGHSKFALLANFEKMNLKGDNVGDANNIADSIDISDPLDPVTVNLQDSPLITPTEANPNPNAFKDDLDNSHVSPMFEQSIFLDLPVFDHVPYLKRVAVFDEAKLTFGWTFTFVAEVIRPSESIIYNANPRAGLFPTLESKRGNWWTSNWSVGVEIPY